MIKTLCFLVNKHFFGIYFRQVSLLLSESISVEDLIFGCEGLDYSWLPNFLFLNSSLTRMQKLQVTKNPLLLPLYHSVTPCVISNISCVRTFWANCKRSGGAPAGRSASFIVKRMHSDAFWARPVHLHCIGLLLIKIGSLEARPA